MVMKAASDDLTKEPPVDVVFTWVNGSDPKFLQSFHHQVTSQSKVLNEEAVTPARFFDWNTMKYSLKSGVIFVQV